MFCPKCGEKNKEGASFCVKCGESLKGKSAKNTKSNKNVKETKITTDDVKELTKEVTKEMTSKTGDIIKDLIDKPVDALKKHGTEKNFTLALVLIAILSILSGLFVVCVIKNIYSLAMGSLGMLGSGYSYFNNTVSIPYVKVFFMSFLLVFASAFLFPGVLYFVNNMIFKGKEKYKKMFAIYSIISIITSAGLLGAIILSFVAIKLAIVFLILGLALSGFYVFYMIRLVGPKDENKHGYIFVLTQAIFYLIILVLVKLLV